MSGARGRTAIVGIGEVRRHFAQPGHEGTRFVQ